MNTINPSTLWLRAILFMIATLFALSTLAVAQDRVTCDDFDCDACQPFGDVEAQYDDYDNPDLGAIVLQHTTPDDQHANFDVVGPDDFWVHFDFSDDQGEEYVLDDLQPGIYSIAATDEGLQLAHSVVEVRAGEVVNVNVALQAWQAGAFEEGPYDPHGYYGTYEGYEDSYPGYPYGAYTVGGYASYDAADTGALEITDVPETVDVVVTRPNGYSEGFEEPVVIESLAPGLYAVAASGEGTDTSVTTVEIRAGQQLPVTPTTVSLQETQ